MIIHGDCLDRLKELPDNSVDSVVTDPPYGLSFMGKKWDYDVPSEEIWREVLRVLKPGGHLLSACGTRTQHRMAVRIEDAGFEIRDIVCWHYGSGFPKSLDVSKAIDKAAGAKREVIGFDASKARPNKENFAKVTSSAATTSNQGVKDNGATITAPSTDSAKQWQGWGTALKPATELWTLARKPLEKGLTVAQNVQKWGTGAINVDASRIAMTDEDRSAVQAKANKKDTTNSIIEGFGNNTATHGDWSMSKGRWPANVIFNEDASLTLPLDSQGESVSRFFYVAKASKSERNRGLEGMPKKAGGSNAKGYTADVAKGLDRNRPVENFHPTVKPIKLMEYLIRMITPPGGTCLDPFAGSGTTGVAATKLGFGFIGIEREAEYVAIAKKRIEAAG